MNVKNPLPGKAGPFPQKIGIILLWLMVWELADRLVHNRIILVGPVRIVSALVHQLTQNDFWTISSASFLRIATGFLLSFAIGFLLAMAAYRFRLLRDFLEPVMVTLKTIPMISFVIMLLIWVGNQALTIYLSFLIVLPIIYTNTLAGFQNANKEMLEMATVFRLSPWKRFLYIYRPAFMPFLMSSCRVSLGMSWKSGIMAEVIGTPKPSIGREMYAAKSYLQTADLFAWTVIVIVLSIVFEKAFMFLLKKLNKPLGSLIGRGK
jgi:NitT/TauT family transport system permease protein